MERGLVLVLMLLAEVVLRLAMQLQVLAVLVVFPLFGMVLVLVLAIQRMVLSVVMQLLLYRRQTLPSRCRVADGVTTPSKAFPVELWDVLW
jgi:hypothetical protein